MFLPELLNCTHKIFGVLVLIHRYANNTPESNGLCVDLLSM